ncbi:right-handed parallel beta-helix repeat-containing protein [Leifsonia sp. TF02-11]|uniref:right-handed parallel beta-helix repeat-containing protein n=1 Tax=Leifsonia sp. TF02-11 TaxID=2815212 RepID=UPI001AA1723D|nr:right-handed parallel beta-helix repeat-containing protein [Leifsonia sp. TF02-11]MBO1739479.1 right-handed parallel beta-helix repeat-containing protein [Leifsonia sp. TF02-11]
MFRMRALAIAAAVGISAAAAVVAIPAPALAVGTTYYVDAAAGSDTAAGTTQATAWKSLAKVDATTFAAGDSILFKRGQSWAGQLHPLGSGTATSPITIDAYGTGAAPKIDGGTLAGGGAVLLKNQHDWTIRSLEVVNDSGTDNFGTLAAPGLTRSGILVDNAGGGTLNGITIQGTTVHDVNGCFNCSDVDAHLNGGIVVYAEGASDSFSNVHIVGNTVHDLGRTGIVFWDASYYTTTPYALTQSALSTGVVVEQNTVQNVDSDGILTFGTDGALIQNNVVGNPGQKTIAGSTEAASAGLWPTRSMNTTVQYNEVYGTLTHDTDGQGFDSDLLNVNTVFQYNYSHDNQGGFLLMMGGYSSTLVVRYNLSVNDGWGGVKGVFTFSYGVPTGTDIYNNTVYIPSGATSKPIFCDGCDGTTTGAWSFRDNIVENHGSGDYLYPNVAGAVIDSNVFFGSHPAGEPADAHKLTTDPQLVSPSGAAPTGLTAVTGYQLQPTSPAIGTGAVIAANGGRDYFGRTVSATAAPSRGFHEAQNITGPTTLVDDASGWGVSSSHTSNMIIDTSTPLSNMNGDASRFSRSNGSAGSVTWLFDGMKTFSATVYEFSADLTKLTFASSPDGTTWTNVATSHTTPAATTNGWASTTVTPTATLPTGTKYLKATISATTAWSIELGSLTISK